MKKIRNIFNILLALAAVVFTQACGDDVEYTPAGQLSNAQVYFPSTNSASIRLTKADSSFEIPIMRIKTGEALTVAVTATGGEGLYNIPTSVDFGQDDTKASLNISFDPETLEYDAFTTITLKLSDETLETPYGMNEYTFTVGIPAPWTSLGKCTFVEDFVSNFFGVSNTPYAVEIQENDLQPGYFRLVNPFGEAYPYNEPGDWDDSQDWYFEIHAENPDAVYINVQNTGMNWGYGNFYMGSMAGYYLAQGATMEEVQAQGYTGIYKDGVISFPTGVLLCGMAEYNDGGLYPANNNGAFRVAMPGVVLADYKLGIAYGGKYTSSKGEDAGVLAQLTEVGADLENVRLAVVEGTDVELAIANIKNGTIEYVEVSPEVGTTMIPFSSSPATGPYTLVAVAYADNEVKATASAAFNYTAGPAETWTQIGTGDYVYTQFFTAEDGGPYTDEGLALFQSNDDPTRYKIEHWGNDVNFIFNYDETTGEVMVTDQEVGYVHPNYGSVFVDDLVDYTGGTNYGYSYFEDGVFHFAVVYYVNEGEFGFGEETFTLTSSTNSTTTMRSFRTLKVVKFGQLPTARKQFNLKKLESAPLMHK